MRSIPVLKELQGLGFRGLGQTLNLRRYRGSPDEKLSIPGVKVAALLSDSYEGAAWSMRLRRLPGAEELVFESPSEALSTRKLVGQPLRTTFELPIEALSTRKFVKQQQPAR